ncbi:MAG TPA: hypothetical protein V6D25_30925 [Leptolyngbyaceae cyanobacterium]
MDNILLILLTPLLLLGYAIYMVLTWLKDFIDFLYYLPCQICILLLWLLENLGLISQEETNRILGADDGRESDD